MKHRSYNNISILYQVFLIPYLMMMLGICSALASDIRHPIVAGKFYPENKDILKSEIKGFLSKVPNLNKLSGKIYGFIVPHAGFVYSGETAAYAFKLLENIPVSTIIIIGPYHKSKFEGVSIWDKGKWKTPLRMTDIDQELAADLKQYSKSFHVDQTLHLKEHSIEVQLPFIQVVAPHALILPILISDPAYSLPLAKAIYHNTRDKNIIVLASTDLSHYHSDKQARLIDKQTIRMIKEGDPKIFRRALEDHKIELCGGAAVLTLLELSNLYDSNQIDILNSSNSGDSSKNLDKVVGYVSAVVQENDLIRPANQKWLLKLARSTLTSYIKDGKHLSVSINDPQLSEPKAVFVTLRDREGKLRGCIGRLKAVEPLYKAVQHMVIAAATRDSRFPPVKFDEINHLNIEISVLTEPKAITSISDFKMGKHGVIMSKEKNRGVFLPDVANLFKTKELFLAKLCSQKAKLPRNCWTDPHVNIEVFTSQNFSEKNRTKD